jgi:hypothetical protein
LREEEAEKKGTEGQAAFWEFIGDWISPTSFHSASKRAIFGQ